MAEYDIWALADAQADYNERRQEREREERERIVAARLAELEKEDGITPPDPDKPEHEAAPDAGA